MVAATLSRALLSASSEPTNDEHDGPVSSELLRVVTLAKSMTAEKLESVLHGMCKRLTTCLLPELKGLEYSVPKAPDGTESKFASHAQLSYSGLNSFFGGLEGQVGAPAPKVFEGMQTEHTQRADSDVEFTTPNYGITTTSKQEWQFVVELPTQKWPAEAADKVSRDDRRRKPLPLFELEAELSKKNVDLEKLQQPALIREELIGGRLYTGPLFVKYNGVLRGGREDDPPYLRGQFIELCCGMENGMQVEVKANKYTTTLHVINSCIIKLSKLTIATKVYRGVSGMTLPDEFFTANEFGVRGGIELAFMSTTTNRNVAMDCAGCGKIGLVFEMQMGMVDRGADLRWLSQYPHEAEVLFGPLSGVEVQFVRVEGSLLIVNVKLSVNLVSLTIEQVLSKRRKVVQDMCEQLQSGMDNRMTSHNKEWRRFFQATDLTAMDVGEYLRVCYQCHSDSSADHYNDNTQLGRAIAEVVVVAESVSEWPQQFQRLQEDASAHGDLLGVEELVLGLTAHANGAGVAALLVANKKLAKLDLTSAKLSTEDVIMVAAAAGRLQVLVLRGNDVHMHGTDALAQLTSMKLSVLRMLDLTDVKATDGGRNQHGLDQLCVALEKNTVLTDLRCARRPNLVSPYLARKRVHG
jgi:hypothetical protein